jgi:ADP-dependent NAD(P)H-hydrate dehydratase / NAD(P)H-hydrate epimerase
MRAAERSYPGPTLELMERAGAGAAEALLRWYDGARAFSLWCGTGNNGGDGFVVATKLREAGRDVQVKLVGQEEKVWGDAGASLASAREAGVAFVEEPRPADVVVDALFGTGFTGSPRPDAARAIAAMNDAGAPVVAIDVPSGVDASTGEVEGPAVEADRTVTFHAAKLGLAVAPGRFYAGDVAIVDIGIEGGESRSGRVRDSIVGLVPRRGPRDNKYSAGAVLVVGGSTGLTGAPSLASEAALRAGAGIVTACVPSSLNVVFEQRLVEVMTRPCADEGGHLTPAAANDVVDAARRAGAVAVGPGLGRTDGTRELVRVLLSRLELPLVVDADALWALTGHLDWVFERGAPTVLTPHAGELGRLLGRPSAWVNGHRLRAVGTGADEVGATVLLKGADTLVAAPGKGVLVSDLGTPGLATAGSGDVLTGVVAAFLAKGMEPRLAAAAAAAAAGLAAREAAARHGDAGLIARDVIEALSPVVSR